MPHLREIVERVLAGDPTFDASELASSIALCRHWLRDEARGGTEHNATTIAELDELLSRLKRGSYSMRMRLSVGGWSLDIDNMDAPAEAGERAIAELAGEACGEPSLLTADLVAWLCGGEAQQAGRFWYELGRRDEHHQFQARVRELATRDDGAHGFMLYVVGWCERESAPGRAFFDEVAGEDVTSARAIVFGALEIDPPDVGAERIVQLIREGKIEATDCMRRFQGGRWLRDVSEASLVRVLELVAGPDLENSGQIPALLELRLLDLTLENGPIADFAWRCLEAHPMLDRHMGDYYSDHLAGRLAGLDPDRGFALLERCIVDKRSGERWNRLIAGPNHLVLWQELSRRDRQRALNTVLDAGRCEARVRWTIQFWLHGLIDITADADFLLRYAAAGESEALMVCEAITSGRADFWPIAFGLIELHPTSEHLRGALELRVEQTGQVVCGPYSEHHRRRIADVEHARQLPEATPAIRAWLDDLAGRLQQLLEIELRRDADERVNRG